MKFSISLQSLMEIITRLRKVADPDAFESRYHYLDIIAKDGKLTFTASRANITAEITTASNVFHLTESGECTVHFDTMNTTVSAMYHFSNNKSSDIVEVHLDRERLVMVNGYNAEYVPCETGVNFYHINLHWETDGVKYLTMPLKNFKRVKNVIRAVKKRYTKNDGYTWKNLLQVHRKNNVVSIEACDTTRYHLMRFYNEGPDFSMLLNPESFEKCFEVFSSGKYVTFEQMDSGGVYVMTCGDVTVTTYQRGVEYPNFSDIAKNRIARIKVSTVQFINSLRLAKKYIGKSDGGVEVKFDSGFIKISPFVFDKNMVNGKTFERTRVYFPAETMVVGSDSVSADVTKSYPVNQVLDMVARGTDYFELAIDEKGILYAESELMLGMVHPYIS